MLDDPGMGLDLVEREALLGVKHQELLLVSGILK